MSALAVCPLNGDQASERALPSAFDAARLLDAPLELFSAVEDGHMTARRCDYLANVGALRRGAGAENPVMNVVVDPHAPRALAARSASSDVHMVMATSSQPLLHTGYLGSAAERVARETSNPVILIGPHNVGRLGDVSKVVVACDGSDLSQAIVPDALAWAGRLGADLWMVTVLNPQDTKQSNFQPESEPNYVRRLATEVGAQWEVLHGPEPAKALTEWAGPASLIAMTTHGRSGFSRVTLGSVATTVTRWATGPVLVGNTHGTSEASS